jgi:geranylgeranyl diphosphate synthase type I
MKLLSDYFDRLLPIVEADLQTVLTPTGNAPPLFYQMLHYHMGWVDEKGQPVEAKRGKRIRPILCLLTCEAGCGDQNLQKETTDPAVAARMLQILGETCLELTRGQHLDMTFEDREKVTTDEYLDMIEGKTAALLRGSALLGALAGGCGEDAQQHYALFGRNLGLAFQVLDDILDIWGDPALTGKKAAIDIHQRKKSLPVLYGLERSEELQQLYAAPDPFDDSAVARIVALLDQVGAHDYADHLARHYSDETLRHLAEAQPQGEAAWALNELVHYLLHRDR